MTREEARKEAERIVNEYQNGGYDGEDFPYDLELLYEHIPFSALSDSPEEIEVVIKAFADHIEVYHSPLYKLMRESEDSSEIEVK